MQLFNSALFNNDSVDLAQVLNATDAGLWKLELTTGKMVWSAGFYQLLGYAPGAVDSSFNHLTEQLLYYKDKPGFLQTVYDHQTADTASVEIRLLTPDGFRWFNSSVKRVGANTLIGTLINIQAQKDGELKAAELAHAQQLSKLAVWKINLIDQQLFLNDAAFDFIELEEHTTISIDEFISFYEPEHRETISRAIAACRQQGRPFDVELQFRSVKNRVVWVATRAVAELNAAGQCIAIQGTLQNIQKIKEQELEYQSKLQVADRQNKRLQNFAHIVSHNLRSYSGNLQALIGLFKESESTEEQDAAFSRIETIGDSLNKTIEHLSEMVKVEFELNRQRTLIRFSTLLENILQALQGDIVANGAIIESDFKLCPTVYYQPAYLESILLNLLTNAIKYRHPDRVPHITVQTSAANGNVYLILQDNGLGIDLDKYGQQLFGIYQTFHAHPQAQGIGLFMTRNQVEAMGGSISVESKVNEGTKFIIQLV